MGTPFRSSEINTHITEFIIDNSYPYIQVNGSGGVDMVPTPYGYFYPISGIWGEYKNVLEVYINGNRLPDSDWREFSASEKNGFGNSGRGAYGGFAHAIILLNGRKVYTDDVIRMVCRQRILNNIDIYGLRIGATVSDPPDIYREEIHVTKGYTHPTGTGNNVGRMPNNTIFWLYPIDAKYLIVLHKLTRYGSGRHKRGTLSVLIPSVGRVWRPFAAIDSSRKYYTIRNSLSTTAAIKLSVMDKESGAIGRLSSESITWQRSGIYNLRTMIMKG